jgi:glycosyltransferase involved in cell wall biosynthesis
MDRPAFSICIPNYNYGRYIGETIKSVLDQTYPDYEIVVVDNASTDDSVEVVRSFGSDRIRLFQNEYNVGFAPNLDRAAMRATNPFIIMLSSDDLMRRTALEEYARVLEHMGGAAEHSLVVSSVDVIDGEGKVGERYDRRYYFDLLPEPAITALFTDESIQAFCGLQVFKQVFPRMSVPGQFCSTLYSRRLYERVGGYSSVNHIGPDAHFAYKALLQNATVVFVGKPLFAYRIHRSNQLALDRKQLTIKLPIDRYLFALQYSEEELGRAGVRRDEMIHFLIDDTCLKGGWIELRRGSAYQAFRYLMFALASYPGMALRNWKAFALAALLLLGPLGTRLARISYRFYASQKNPVKQELENAG